ncbi:MAG: ectonucleotide pyrophosphatase/phosphodiesterase [Polyangiaceae bacterium]
MRPRPRAVVLAALMSSTACGPSEPAPKAPVAHARKEPAGPIQHVILVTVDGLLPEVYLHPDVHGLKIPTLRWLVAHGAMSDGAMSVFPTVTYPSHTSMVTGVLPGTHGIVSNRTFDPYDNDLEGWNWYAEDIKVDPVWRIAERAGYQTALVHWPVSVGAQVTWKVPEYWRAKNDEDKKIVRALSTPGLLDDVAREHPDFWPRFKPPVSKDDALTDIATHLLAKEKPTLMLLHLVEVDGSQHGHGVFSPAAIAAIEKTDLQLARLLDTLRKSGLDASTSLVVASDHGFMDAGSMVKPGVLLRQAGLITTNDAGKVTEWKATLTVNSGQAYVYVKDPNDNATRDALRSIFDAKAKEPNGGIGRVYSSAEIVALGGDPKAFLAIEAAAGFQLGNGSIGEYVAPPAYKATHGYDPRRPEMRTSLILFGPNVPHGTIAGARLIDIGPTIASWLGLSMPQATGTPLHVTAAP